MHPDLGARLFYPGDDSSGIWDKKVGQTPKNQKKSVNFSSLGPTPMDNFRKGGVLVSENL